MKNSKFLIVIVLLLSNVVCFAQDGTGTGFDDNVADVPAAPINQWVFVAIIVAVLYGYKSIKKTVKNNSQKA
jgi:hypothetical protein